MIGGRSGEWHWLWDAYVFGMCAAAAAGVVMLDHRFSGNVPVALTALAGIVVCVLAFGRRCLRERNDAGEALSQSVVDFACQSFAFSGCARFAR